MQNKTLDELRLNYLAAHEAYFAAAKVHAARDRFEVDPLRTERLAFYRAKKELFAAAR
jgi:hypothetical protein